MVRYAHLLSGAEKLPETEVQSNPTPPLPVTAPRADPAAGTAVALTAHTSTAIADAAITVEGETEEKDPRKDKKAPADLDDEALITARS